jgi:hypothetical protein
VATVVGVVDGTVVDDLLGWSASDVVEAGGIEVVGADPGSTVQAARTPMMVIKMRRMASTLCPGSANRLRRRSL